MVSSDQLVFALAGGICQRDSRNEVGDIIRFEQYSETKIKYSKAGTVDKASSFFELT